MTCNCDVKPEVSDSVVIIPKKEYKELKERDLFLTCLEMQGVDSWEGYEDAQDVYESISE